MATRVGALASDLLRAIRLSALALALGAAHGCGSDPTAAVLTMQIVTPNGGDPLGSAAIDHVVVHVRQGDDAASAPIEADVVDGTFDLRAPLVDAARPVRAGVELSLGGALVLHGAPPVFTPGEAPGVVTIPVGAPDTCAVLASRSDTPFALPSPRVSPALIGVGSFALVSGGEMASDELPVAFLDLLTVLPSPDTEDAAMRVGAARAVQISPLRVLVVGEQSSFVYDLSTTNHVTPIDGLHAGAAMGALIAVEGGGAVLVGGESPLGTPIPNVTIVSESGLATAGNMLAVARSLPAAHAMSDGRVLVVGGASMDLVEVIDPVSGVSTPMLVPGFTGSGDARRGGALFADPDDPTGGRFLLLGGTNIETSAPHAETWIFEGCPACVAEPGPSFDAAREGATLLATPSGGLVIGGIDSMGMQSAQVDVVRWEAAEPVIEAGGDLGQARANAGAMVLESGIVLVAGGDGTSGPRDDIEICFPRILRGL